MNIAKYWQRLNWGEYLAKASGTAFMIFVGLSAVVINMGQVPMEKLIPASSWRLLLTGIIFAGSGSLVAVSPLGKLSGGHINPSVSLAFWLQGKMHGHDFIGYVVAQFLGAIAGQCLLVFFWRDYARSVNNGMTLPGENYALWYVFLAEVLITFLLVFLILIFVSTKALMRWTPLMTWIVIALMVWLESPISGTSLNTARSFAPALLSNVWQAQWIYAIAPPLGSVAGVLGFRLLTFGKREILTGKLFHEPNYRCIFKNIAPFLLD